MLVLFTSDLHGKTVLYEQLFGLIRKRLPPLVLLGGDLLPKLNEGENLFQVQRHFIRQELAEFFYQVEQIRPSVEVGIMLGNDDSQSLRGELSLLADQGLFHLIDGNEWITSSGWRVIGFNVVPETPFSLKDLERRDCEGDQVKYPLVEAIRSTKNGYEAIDAQDWLLSHPSIAEELTYLPPIVESERTIFVSHVPPRDTPLDKMVDGKHVGSAGIRFYIESNQPLVSLHGHIHESWSMSGTYASRLGNTVCFNPGQIHYPALDAVFIDTDDPLDTKEHTANRATPTKEGLNLLRAPFGN